MGKQHVGYARLRAGVDTILEERRKRREDRDKEKVGATLSLSSLGPVFRIYIHCIRKRPKIWIWIQKTPESGSKLFLNIKLFYNCKIFPSKELH